MYVDTEMLADLAPAGRAGAAWEQLVAASPEGGAFQSLHWARFKRRQGCRVLALAVIDGAALVGGVLCYAAPAASGSSLFFAPEGPILPWADEERARRALGLLLPPLEQAAAAHDAVGLRVEPRLSGPRPRTLRLFRRAPSDVVPRETLYLDLTPRPDAILAAMHPKTRYNIRLAARHGVHVREDRTVAAVAPLHGLLCEAAARDGFFVEPRSTFDALVESLGPAGIGRVLLAERDGEALGALFLLTYGGRATYLYGGVSGRQRHVMAGYALQWAAITAARCRVSCLRPLRLRAARPARSPLRGILSLQARIRRHGRPLHRRARLSFHRPPGRDGRRGLGRKHAPARGTRRGLRSRDGITRMGPGEETAMMTDRQNGRIPAATVALYRDLIAVVQDDILGALPAHMGAALRSFTVEALLDILLQDLIVNGNAEGPGPADIADLRSFVALAAALAEQDHDREGMPVYRAALRGLLRDWLENWNAGDVTGPPLGRG